MTIQQAATHAGTVAPSAEGDLILELRGVQKHFQVGGGLLRGRPLVIHAVDDISFSLRKGETLGLVGESGCGKTTLGQTIVRLYQPTAGSIVFKGDDISRLSPGQMRPYRRYLQMIFQDPSASLDPRMTVSSIISEPLTVSGWGSKKDRQDRVRELLKEVGLNSYFANRYPHEFSGGQRQRIGIARALAMGPELVVCDEPVSALDVSIQAQVLNLMKQLQEQYELTYLFIAHNLAVVAHIADRIGVMYLGKLVELADARTITENPKHPYTKALISAIPVAAPGRIRDRIILQGDVPSPANPPTGCRFHPRCPIAQPNCAIDEPILEEKEVNHFVACHYA